MKTIANRGASSVGPLAILLVIAASAVPALAAQEQGDSPVNVTAPVSARELYVAGKPFDVGSRWLLLADDYFVEDRFGIERVTGDVIKLATNPVLTSDLPWEDGVSTPRVLFDESKGIYHMWYKIYNRTGYTYQFGRDDWDPAKHAPPYFVGYARSDDGINWEKPLLDVFPSGEFSRTNIVLLGEARAQEHNVWLNHDQSDPERRFVMTYKDVPRRLHKGSCLMLAYSGDGIHWSIDRETSPLACHLLSPA